ncbi:hypothetical protein BSKO_13301 [Bryopsis sp. KO-2023]|nr:hypothetical protein BSKO_13301 [Bryopsis sp. KO-2023]
MEELDFPSSGNNSQSMSAEKENITWVSIPCHSCVVFLVLVADLCQNSLLCRPRPEETPGQDALHSHPAGSLKDETRVEAPRQSWDSSEQETARFESESPNSSDESCQEGGFVPTCTEGSKWGEEARVLAQVALSDLSLGEEAADQFNLPSAGSRDGMDINDIGACHDTKVKNITMAKKMLLRSELRNSSSTSENAGSCSIDSRKPVQPRHGKHGRHGGGRGSNPRHAPQRRPRGKHRRSGCHQGGRPGGWHGTRDSPPPPPPPPPPSARKRGSNSSQNYAEPARRPVGRLEPQVEVCVLNLLQALSDCYGDMATSLIPQPQVRSHPAVQYDSRTGVENCAGGSSGGSNNVNLISIPSQATPTANPYAGYLPVLAQNANGEHVPAWIPADLLYNTGGPGGAQESAANYQHLAFQHGYYENAGNSGPDNFGGHGGEEFRD